MASISSGDSIGTENPRCTATDDAEALEESSSLSPMVSPEKMSEAEQLKDLSVVRRFRLDSRFANTKDQRGSRPTGERTLPDVLWFKVPSLTTQQKQTDLPIPRTPTIEI